MLPSYLPTFLPPSWNEAVTGEGTTASDAHWLGWAEGAASGCPRLLMPALAPRLEDGPFGDYTWREAVAPRESGLVRLT